MYFGPSISVGRRGVSYGDSDVAAFLSATGITGATEVSAINNLVANLKTYGLWSKMKAIYPIVSDTKNLVSYSEDFTNGVWTKNNITVTGNSTTAPDGTNTADSFFETNTTALHYSDITSITTTNGLTFTASVYLKANGRNYATLGVAGESNYATFDIANGTVGLITGTCTPTITSAGNGWFRCSVSSVIAAGGSNRGIFICVQNANQGLVSYAGDSTKGLYIWGAQLEQGTLTTYQPIATTPANRFVSQFKYNLKDPRDLDAAFRLAFNGTWTYSKQGALPNGVNAYANTYLNPSTVYSTNDSLSLGYYSRDIASPQSTKMGSADAGLGNGSYLIVSYSGTSYNRITTSTSQVVGSIGTTPGLYALSRIASTNFKYFRNTTLIQNGSIASTGRTSNTMWIGGVNYGASAEYGAGQTAFNYIGDGLSDSEISSMYTLVQNFQTTLGRQV